MFNFDLQWSCYMVGMIEFIFFRLATAVKSFNMKPYRKSNNRIIKIKKNTLDRTYSVHEKLTIIKLSMYILSLINFTISKKTFEYLSIGSNVLL
jgi:hypothetical protein